MGVASVKDLDCPSIYLTTALSRQYAQESQCQSVVETIQETECQETECQRP